MRRHLNEAINLLSSCYWSKLNLNWQQSLRGAVYLFTSFWCIALKVCVVIHRVPKSIVRDLTSKRGEHLQLSLSCVEIADDASADQAHWNSWNGISDVCSMGNYIQESFLITIASHIHQQACHNHLLPSTQLKMGTDIPQQAIQLPLQMTKASLMQWLPLIE